jgi:hypothetical protein
MPDRDPNGEKWTLETLRIFFDKLIEANDARYQQRFQQQGEALTAAFLAQKSAVDAALAAADRAVTKAEIASEKRFDAVNEFRRSLDDLSRLQMPRLECEQRLGTLKEQVDRVEDVLRSRGAQNAGAKDSWAMIVAIISFLGTVAAIVYAMGHLH